VTTIKIDDSWGSAPKKRRRKPAYSWVIRLFTTDTRYPQDLWISAIVHANNPIDNRIETTRNPHQALGFSAKRMALAWAVDIFSYKTDYEGVRSIRVDRVSA